jgi:hypothetical protein
MINALFGGEQLGWQLAELAVGTLCARSVPKAFPLGPARRGCVLVRGHALDPAADEQQRTLSGGYYYISGAIRGGWRGRGRLRRGWPVNSCEHDGIQQFRGTFTGKSTTIHWSPFALKYNSKLAVWGQLGQITSFCASSLGIPQSSSDVEVSRILVSRGARRLSPFARFG